jgi:hypothetical protein
MSLSATSNPPPTSGSAPELETRRRDVGERLARMETIVGALARRAAEQAEQAAARETEAAIAAEIAAHTTRAEELRSEAAREEQAATKGRERLAVAEAETIAAVAEFLPDFDKERALRAQSAVRQRAEQARWWAKNHPHDPGDWPLALREAIPAAIDALKERAVRDVGRQRRRTPRRPPGGGAVDAQALDALSVGAGRSGSGDQAWPEGSPVDAPAAPRDPQAALDRGGFWLARRLRWTFQSLL